MQRASTTIAGTSRPDDGAVAQARAARAFAPIVAVAAALWLALVLAAGALAAPPALTGRVVDQAGVLSAGTKAHLVEKLDALEAQSSIQLVVATVSSLDGSDIETYANALFRAWGLGVKDKNNGVLMLVAPNERKVRIEVGYGLEGVLTDALAKLIIVNAVTPRFKAGVFDGGVQRGVDDIVTVLTTEKSEWQKRPEFRAESEADLFEIVLPLIVFALFVFVVVSMVRNARTQVVKGRRRGHVIVLPPMGGGWGGGQGLPQGKEGLHEGSPGGLGFRGNLLARKGLG